MSSSSSSTPPDTVMVGGDAFNDKPYANGRKTSSPIDNGNGDNSSVPKPKRLACMICRKRKLKCDGTKPSCSTCSRLGHTCAYDEVRRKSGPKRGYVKALEERLRQVETMLKTQDVSPGTGDANKAGTSVAESFMNTNGVPPFTVQDPATIGMANSRDKDRWQFNGESPQNAPPLDDLGFAGNIDMASMNQNFTWEMVGLGLEEPLPPQETIDELHQIYFEKIHPSCPMIHRFRYLAAMNLAPNQRPPVCLRYAIWTVACSVTDKYGNLKDLFYQRARKYLEADYIKGFGEHMISVAHTQTHILLGHYEFKMMYFPRAWMSAGAAAKMAQMLGLHRMDGAGLDVKECLPPPRDWTEREERRRTWWMAFCEDRYASIGTGWPMTIDERDILTNLPASDDAFDMSRPEQTQPLQDAMNPSGANKLSSFGGIVLMACLFGRNLTHLHRPDVDDRDNDLNGEFWKRHRNMDNVLLNTSLCLPPHLKLPSGLTSPNIVFTNMCIHTSTICLHQAAIFKADKNKLPASVSAESKVRCITAANETASIMRMISHMDLSGMNPFIAFSLYVAARVFVQYLKSRPDDSQTVDSLRFLLSAMNALKRRNPLTESFLVQLDVDLEALGTRIPKLKAAFPKSSEVNMPSTETSIPGAPCNAEEESNGIMAYRNECVFLKTAEDDGNPVNGPDIVEPDSAQSQDSSLNDMSNQGQIWLRKDMHTIPLPSRGRSTGPSAAGSAGPWGINNLSVPSGTSASLVGNSSTSPSVFGHSENGSSMNDVTNSPDGVTPNSGTSEQRHMMGTATSNGRLSASGGGSFEASPASSHQNLGSTGQTPGDGSDMRAVNAAAAYLSDPTAYSIAAGEQFGGMPPANAAGQFAVPNGWEIGQNMGQGGTPMTPVSEGVLRSIMQMGPMEAMDLQWPEGQ